MVTMNRVVQLVQTGAVALRRFDHVPGVVHHDPERERAAGHAVSFVETGSFRVRTTGAWREVGMDSLFVTTPGMEFSCAHDEEHPAGLLLLGVVLGRGGGERACRRSRSPIRPCAR